MNTLYKTSLFQYKQLAFYSNINIIYKINKYKLSKNFFIKKAYFLHKNNYLFNKIIINTKFLYSKYKEPNINLLNTLYPNEYLHYLKKLGFFQLIKYSNISFKNNEYNIFYLKYNPIIIKIDIQNYTKLKIPKYILVKYLYRYIGLPINYRLIDNSMQSIYKWYINRGFKWVKIKYFYNMTNNQITIFIDEGKIKNIYIQIFNQKKLLSVILEKEFNLIDQNIINSYILENYIKKLKDKYNLHSIEYYIKPKIQGLNLIITYNIYDNKYQSYYITYIIKDSQQYFTNIAIYISQLYNKYNYRSKRLLLSLSSLYLSNLIKIKPIKLFYKYKIFNINNLKQKIIYWVEVLIFYNINLIKLNIIIPNFKFINFYQIHTLLSFIIKQININEKIFAKDVKISYISIYLSKYLYKVTSLELKLQVNTNNLHHIILKNYQFYQKNIKILLYRTLKNIQYNYQISHLQYLKYKLQYYSLNVYKINFFNISAMLNIKYQLYLYSPNIKNYLTNIFKYYLHMIKIQYEQFYPINQLQFINNNFNIFSEINIFTNNLQSSPIFIDYVHYTLCNKISEHKYTIFYDIEYQIFFNHYNYIYIFFNYLPIKTKYLIYTYHQYTKQIYKYLKIGMGMQIYLPVKSLPIIRLEAKIIDNHQILFYTYLMPKLYK